MRSLLLTLFIALVPTVGCTKLTKDEPEPPKKDEKIVGKFTREVGDLAELKREHPDWVEINPEISGNDPLTQAGTAYDALTYKSAMLGWEKQRQFFEAESGTKIPPYAVAKQFVERDGPGLPMVRPYKHWAYDAEAGKFVLLLDKEARNKVYKQKGIPIPD